MELAAGIVLVLCIAIAMVYRAVMGSNNRGTSADMEFGDGDGGGGDGGD